MGGREDLRGQAKVLCARRQSEGEVRELGGGEVCFKERCVCGCCAGVVASTAEAGPDFDA